MINPLKLRNPYGSPEDVADRYDPEGIPQRTSKRVEEIAAKLNEVIDYINRQEINARDSISDQSET